MAMETHRPGMPMIVPGLSDAQAADEIRKGITAQLEVLATAMDEAKSKGFTVEFGMGLDYRGKNIVGRLVISKQF